MSPKLKSFTVIGMLAALGMTLAACVVEPAYYGPPARAYYEPAPRYYYAPPPPPRHGHRHDGHRHDGHRHDGHRPYWR